MILLVFSFWKNCLDVIYYLASFWLLRERGKEIKLEFWVLYIGNSSEKKKVGNATLSHSIGFPPVIESGVEETK